LKHGGLFEGIGGFSLAAHWMGWETSFWCEWNEFGQRVLKHHFPGAVGYGDITKTDFTIWRGKIDILTGGFPCQPFSQAGKRKGTEDDRYLWPEMLRAIREIRPGFIVGENVYGLVNWDGGLVFDTVCSDLEAEGYEVCPVILPACAKNAPHQRARIWFIAHTPSDRLQISDRRSGQKQRVFDQTSTGFHFNRFAQWDSEKRGRGRVRNGDGLPTELDGITFSKWRNESIKAYGNAIVPQVAYEIFKSIEIHTK
jgi:DNA (cytosine-5)-methyltransferase 1